jgi:hypothetical protein
VECPFTAPDADVKEMWTHWQCHGRRHVAFQIPVWSAEVISEVLYLTSTAIGAMSTVSLHAADAQRSLAKGPGPAWLRVSHSDPRRLSAVVRALPEALRPAGVTLHQADGRHAPALLATIPLGRSLS